MNHPGTIHICSDFIMTKEKEQFSNLRWLFALLHRPIALATGISPKPFKSSLSIPDDFSRERFFRISGIPFNKHLTHHHFDDSSLHQASVDYLREFIKAGDLVVGYELSEQTRRLLTRMDVTYIDIWLHPVRYLDDILFAFSSNNGEIFERLKLFSLDPETFYLCATRISIGSFKGFRRVDHPIVPGSAMFVGQTLEDKAICRQVDGRMLSVLDFREDFEEAGRTYRKVYYSRHPYVRSGDEQILRYVRSRPFAEIIQWPSYEMLASEKLSYVFGVSSSLIHEAKYFQKETRFLYQPIFELSEEFGLRSYLSVFQEFVSPHFWSDILSPVMATTQQKRIAFTSSKDQLRDMLGFYWSYRDVDKVENMRQKLLVLARQNAKQNRQNAPQQSLSRGNLTIPKPIRSEPGIELSKLSARFGDYDTISFDAFDTLLVRTIEKPSHLFELMEPEVAALTNYRLRDFSRARQCAREWSNRTDSEEVPLLDRYEAIRQRYDLSFELRDRLVDLELQHERRLIRRRISGKVLFDAALDAGKRVVVISDTFFTTAFLDSLLREAGYRDYQLFTSSEHKCLKATGHLFEKVSLALGVAPDRILHVGDNLVSDVKMAEKSGYSAHHLPQVAEVVNKRVTSFSKIRFANKTFETVARGLVASRLADDPFSLSYPSASGGNPAHLGYALIGPMVFAFARWIIRNAHADNVERLFCLARDGDIVHRALELMRPYVPETPDTRYLYASRRGCQIPNLRTEEDVQALLTLNFSPTTLSNLLEMRFGLSVETIDKRLFEQVGFSGANDVLSSATLDERSSRLISMLSPRILNQAEVERGRYLSYLKNEGFFERSNIAVVDIGHHGSLQLALARLTGINDLGGYYFATMDGISQLSAERLNAKGFVAQGVSHKDIHNPYVRHILLFELMFSNSEGSFVRIDETNQPKLRTTAADLPRAVFMSKVHEGALDFIRDAVTALEETTRQVALSGSEAIAPLSYLWENPLLLDAELFDGIAFENVYSARPDRYILGNGSSGSGGAIWREGHLARYPTSNTQLPASNSQTSLLVKGSQIGTSLGLLTERKARKLARDPEAFFLDSRNSLARSIGKLFTQSRRLRRRH